MAKVIKPCCGTRFFALMVVLINAPKVTIEEID